MEASLLPSEGIAAIGRETVLVALRRKDGACAELCREFGIVGHNAWFVVLSPTGGFLTCFSADMAGSGCTPETVDRFPELVAGRIRDALKCGASIEELERRCVEEADDSSFGLLATRLEGMQAHGRLWKFCERLLSKEGLPGDLRRIVRFRAFSARSGDLTAANTAEGRRALVDLGVGLVAEFAAEDETAGIVRTLFQVGCARGFDVPGKAGECAARLEKLADAAGDADSLRKRIGEFRKLARDFVSRVEGNLKKAESGRGGFAAAYARGQLGDADATIDFFSRPPYDRNEFFRPWVAEARVKTARGR